MARKGTFLLRTDPAVLNALRRWAGDELRSVNGQVEFILRRALIDAGRLRPKDLDVEANEDAVEDVERKKE